MNFRLAELARRFQDLIDGLSDAREWTATTVGLTEAQNGTNSTRRAWTAQRVRQAITAWWDTVSIAISKVTGLQDALDSKPDITTGTWTPTFVGSTSGSIAGSTQAWRRVGDMMYAFLRQSIDISSLEGNVSIENIPGTPAASNIAIFTHGSSMTYPAGSTFPYIFINQGSTTAGMFALGSGSSTTITGANITGSMIYTATLIYRVS